MMFANTDKEITLIYSSDDRRGKQVLGYAQQEKFPIREVDLVHTKIPGSQWAELADRMGIHVKDFVNTENSEYLKTFEKESDFDQHDWLSLIEKNPSFLKAPIVMKGDKIVFMENPQDMLQFIK